MIRKINSLVYTGHTHTEGGRDGHGRSSDGALDVRLSPYSLALKDSIAIELAIG